MNSIQLDQDFKFRPTCWPGELPCEVVSTPANLNAVVAKNKINFAWVAATDSVSVQSYYVNKSALSNSVTVSGR